MYKNIYFNIWKHYFVFISDFCESLIYLKDESTEQAILQEITRSICRTSLSRYMFVCECDFLSEHVQVKNTYSSIM